MGGFPGLQIQAPQFQNPVEKLAQVSQIAGNLQEVQARQQQIADNQAITKAMLEWDGKDPNALAMGVLRNGGSGNAVFGVTKSILQSRQEASEIAKADSVTAQNNLDNHIKTNDQHRAKLMGIIGMQDPQAQQAAWSTARASGIADGSFTPDVIPETYPGNGPATIVANNLALGSVLAKEQQENQKLALDAWKPSQGKLVNVITNESIGGLKPADIDTYNAALKARWQVLNPGQDVPDYFQLKPGASPVDLDRVDKSLEQTEKAQGTVAQQQQTNAIRQQTFEMARDKADMKSVIGQDPKTGNTVLVPFSQAQQMGIQNPLQASDDQTNKALAARHWLQMANKQAPAGADPSDMGISQLINKLDSEGKLGPLASRWNEFMAGTWGAGDADVAALRAKMGLSTTLLMQAHVGNRGSSAMLEHFEDLANQKKLDGQTLKSAFNSEVNYVTDRAMDPNPPNWNTPARSTISPAAKGQAAGQPAGAIGKVKGSDGQWHWTDGKQDLGVVQ